MMIAPDGEHPHVIAAVQRLSVASGKNSVARRNGRSFTGTLSGCFIRRKPRSVAGELVVEMVRSIAVEAEQTDASAASGQELAFTPSGYWREHRPVARTTRVAIHDQDRSRSEKSLSPVLIAKERKHGQAMPMLVYENSDWIVDSEGIHTKHPPPDYNIFFRSLYDMRDTLEGDMFEWPLHMAHKSGINIHLFNDAFSKAMRYHATLNHRAVDEDLLRRSCEEAVGIVKVRRLRR